MDEIIYHHTSVKPEYTYWDLISDYAFELNMIFVVVAIAVLVSINGTSKRFREMSRRDSMTKLHNSGYFREYIEKQLHKVTTGALFLVDIDFFKEVNDNYGHNMGDRIINQVATHMKGLGNGKGFYARVGGDEFAVFLEGAVEQKQLEQEAAEFLQNMAENETGIYATLSIGGYIFDGQTEYESLYKKADKVLYKVKENGRNGVVVTNSLKNIALSKPSNLVNYPQFQLKVSSVLSADESHKNHALMVIHLDNLQDEDSIPEFFEEVASRIKNQVRQHDFLCAQEDSSFLLFLYSCGTTQNLADCKQRLENSLNQVYTVHQHEITVKTKVTVVIYPEDGENYVELMDKLSKK